MFIVMASVPRYDNRDGICGSTVRQADPYAFQTLALAHRLSQRLRPFDAETGEPLDDEARYYVTSSSDPYRRPIARPATAADYADDIPF